MNPRILIVIPFYSEFEAVKPGLRALLGSGIEFKVQPIQGPYVHNNRNLGVNGGRSQATYQNPLEGFTHFLFIDSDNGFTPAHVNYALKLKSKVVTLPYLTHLDNGEYQVGEMDEDFIITKRYTKYERGVKAVGFTGGGFLLVEAPVFSEIAFPWFHHSLVTIGFESFSVGEDVVFSGKLREAGIPILCDFDHPVPHRLRKMEHYNVAF